MGGEVGVRRWFAFTNTCSPTSYYRCWEEKDVWCSRTILLVWDLVEFEKKKKKKNVKDKRKMIQVLTDIVTSGLCIMF